MPFKTTMAVTACFVFLGSILVRTVAKLFVVCLNAGLDDLLGLLAAEQLLDGGLLVLQLLVDREKMHDFIENVSGQLVDRLHVAISRVREGNGDDLVVLLAAVDHAHTTDGIDLYQCQRIDGRTAQYQNVQRVAVVGVGAGDETVVGGIVGRRVKHAVEAHDTRLFVQLILAGRPLGDLNDGGKVRGGDLSGVNVVPNVHGVGLLYVLFVVGEGLAPPTSKNLWLSYLFADFGRGDTPPLRDIGSRYFT